MRLVTPEQMRNLESLSDEMGVSYEMLMEQAGKNLYAVLMRQIAEMPHAKVVFLCGNGNNGGDCFVAARYLAERGVQPVVALTCGVPKTILAYSMYKKMEHVTVLSHQSEILAAIDTADLLVDGVYGTGFHGELRPEIRELFARAAGRFCIAVDLPSGGDAETGAVAEGTLCCRMTVTFGACKFGMVQYPLKGCCGDVLVADIGLPPRAFDQLEYRMEVITEDFVRALLPSRRPDSHKGEFGKLLCLTGSQRMPGAAAMSTLGALRCGVGLLRLAAPASVGAALSASCYEPMYLLLPTDPAGFVLSEALPILLEQAAQSTAMLIGCGLGVTDETRRLVRELICNAPCPLILDADGINCIVGCIDIIRESKFGIVLTPHAGEMARLMGCTPAEVQENRMFCAQTFAKRCGVTVVLKGAGTIIASPDAVYVNETGNSGMSKGGSGDVLAGMLASFAAQGLSLADAAAFAVYLHGKAGDRAAAKFSEQAMLPTDLIAELPALFLQLEQEKKGH